MKLLGKIKKWCRFLPAEKSEKLRVMFAVSRETPLLKAVLLLLRGMEEESIMNSCKSRLSPDDRAYLAGEIAALKRAQDQIADQVDEANRRLQS